MPPRRDGANVDAMVRVVVSIDPRHLCGTDASVARAPSAARYVARLAEGLRRELPDLDAELVLGPRRVTVEGLDGAEALRLKAHVEAVADAVRQCGDWIVYE
ncbi:MAG: hypothetical protein H6723_11250 [Sandaracinus sp.]|nr:hypothetical protein [Sandaracinus sp.]